MSDDAKKHRSHWPITLLSAFSSLFNTFLPFLIARLLDKNELGEYKRFFLYLALLPAFSFTLGLRNGLSYWAGRESEQKGALQASGIFILLLATISSSLLYIYRDTLFPFLEFDYFTGSIFAFAYFATLASPFFEEAAMASGKVWRGALFYSGSEVIRTVIILLCALLFKDVPAIIIAYTILLLIKTVVGFAWAFKLDLFGLRISPRHFAEVWKYAFPVSLAWCFGVFVTNPDQLVLSKWLDPSAFAEYTVGCLSLGPLLTLEISVSRVLIPAMSEAWSKGETEHMKFLYRDAVSNLALLLIPAFFGLVVFARPIIHILFSDLYLPSAKYLPFYSVYYLLLMFPYDAVVRAQGNSKWILKTLLVSSVVSLSLCGILVAIFGAWGGLFGLLASLTGLRAYGVWYASQRMNWKYQEFIPWEVLLRNSAFCGFLTLLSLWIKREFTSEIWWFVCIAPLFAAGYFILLLLWKNFMEPRRMGPPRVLIVTQQLSIGGLERMVFGLAKTLKKEKQAEVWVFAYDHEEVEGKSLVPLFKEAGITVHAFKKAPGFSIKTLATLLWYSLRYNIEVYHTQDIGCLMYAVCAKLLLLGRGKILQTQHSFIHLNKGKKYALYERFFTFFASRVTVVSSPLLENYTALGYSRKKIRYIPNGVNTTPAQFTSREELLLARDEWIRKSNFPTPLTQKLLTVSQSVWYLYLSRLYPQKGQDHAISLWSKLPREVQEQAVLLIVGPESYEGERARLEALAEKAPDSERILFVGPTSVPQEWRRASDIFLSASEYEGMPLGPLEALCEAVPCLLSTIEGHSLLKEYAEFFSLSDVEGGAEKLASMTRETTQQFTDLRSRVFSSTEELRRTYSLESMAHAYAAEYNALCRRKDLV